MKFLMASKGRSDIIRLAMDFVGREDLVVLVDEVEKEDYEKVVDPPAVLWTHPSLYGLGAILKFGTERLLNEDYIVTVDDDLEGFMYKYEKDMPRFTDTARFRHVVRNTYQMAADLGTPLAGWNYDAGTDNFNQYKPMTLSGYAASLKIIIPRFLGDVMWDERLTIRDDLDFSLQVKYFRRFLLLDLRYATLDKIWKNKGGLSTVRPDAAFREDNRRLLAKWGSKVIRINKDRPKQFGVRSPF